MRRKSLFKHKRLRKVSRMTCAQRPEGGEGLGHSMCNGPKAQACLVSCRNYPEAKVKSLVDKVRESSRKAGHTGSH